MTAEKREETLYYARICFICTDPKAIWGQDHYEDCKKKDAVRNGEKDENSCQVANCYKSIRACATHKKDPLNASLIQKKKNKMTERGWVW